mgnify:CR=1 FL=1
MLLDVEPTLLTLPCDGPRHSKAVAPERTTGLVLCVERHLVPRFPEFFFCVADAS